MGDIGERERERTLVPEQEPGKIRELPHREDVPDPVPATEPVKVPVPA